MVVYIFQGKGNEKVPETVEELVIDKGVQTVPAKFCRNKKHLRKVTLPRGLTIIGEFAFHACPNLLEIKIGRMVQFIGDRAFSDCLNLRHVEFENSTRKTRIDIDRLAFFRCTSLPSVKLPSSVNCIGYQMFAGCPSLIEADLSATRLAEIPESTFAWSRSLQTVNLPSTVELISTAAFCGCHELVTVVVPLNSQPIKIQQASFGGCDSLANLVLPKDSTAEGTSFNVNIERNPIGARMGRERLVLHERYGEDSASILAGLVDRFDDFPIHHLCYDHSTITPEELQECIEEQEEESSLVDEFGMTAFHVLFSTIGPSAELLQVLLNALPYRVIDCKDANGKRPVDYLIKNRTDEAATLLEMLVQKWMIDRINRWGAASWKEEIQSKVHFILSEAADHEQRATMWKELRSSFAHYEIVASMSIFELALWKTKLRSGRRNNSSKRQARDREECRCVSGSDVVIPHVLKFLDTA